MPIALLVRLLLRLAAGLLFWRLATNRRAAYAGQGRPLRGASPRPHIGPRSGIGALRETGWLALRVVSSVVLVCGAALLTAAGLGPVILGPRWIGAVLLALAAAALAGAALTARGAQSLFAARRRRRHDRDLAAQVH